MSKLCIKCNNILPHILFHKSSKAKDGYRSTCIPCRKIEEKKYLTEEYLQKIKDRKKEYAKANYAQVSQCNKRYKVKTRYGVTTEEYQTAMASSSVCEICGRDSNLVFDHDHSKKGIESFRGVLCNSCNRGIGYLQDSKIILQQAIKYLNKGSENE